MLKRIALTAHELDAWLHSQHPGLYGGILRWGLVVSILGSLSTLRHAIDTDSVGVGSIVPLVFQAALLINQLAQWHELNERRRLRRGATQS